MIELKQGLAGRSGTRIYLQYGYQMRFAEVSKLDPYCQFYVYRSSEELRKPLTIAADTFVVHRVYRQRESVSTGTIHLAATGRTNRGPSERTMSTIMELLSEKQPEVTRLVCSRWADPYPMNHVSIDEIVQSLGEIAEFIPPAGES